MLKVILPTIIKKTRKGLKMIELFKQLRNKKRRKPDCYTSNNENYPLCTGAKHPQVFAENDCIHCNLYENTELL
jgi:hypothetical protein